MTAKTQARPIKILLVEDSPDDAELLMAELGSIDGSVRPNVTWVQRRADALERVRHDDYDAVVLDLGLPDSQGLGTVQPFVAIDGGPPVIVLSGVDDDDTAREALKAGAQDYILKQGATAGAILRSIRYAQERTRAHLTHLEHQRHESAAELRRQLINVAAHELSTPLTPISFQLDLLRDEKLGPLTQEQHSALDLLARNFHRLSLRINDVLDASRVDEGRVAISRQAVSINGVVRDVTGLLAGIAEQLGVAVELDLAELPEVPADHDRIEQVVYNLVENALKYTPRGGTVTIHSSVGDEIRVEVEDTGRGLTPDEHRVLLSGDLVALQAVIDNDDKRTGRGVGLFTSRAIVRAHDGTIWCRSSGCGHGSTFGFSLPLKPS